MLPPRSFRPQLGPGSLRAPPGPPPKYQSPPGSGDNDGALPATYDPAWPTYVNLTRAQIVAFTRFPQDLLIYANQRRWEAQVGAGRPTSVAPDAGSLGQASTVISNLFAAHIQLLSQISGASPTVTTRAQIDAAYAAVAPNSPSATNPSLT